MYRRGFLLLMLLMKFGVFSFSLNSWHFAPNPKQRYEWTTKSVIPLYGTCQFNHFILHTKTCKTRLTWKLEKSAFMKKQPSFLASSLFVFSGNVLILSNLPFGPGTKAPITTPRTQKTYYIILVACSKQSNDVYKVNKENKGHWHPLEIGHCNVVNWLRRSLIQQHAEGGPVI